MGTAFTPAKTSPASWDAFADIDAFVDAVLAELAAMAADGTPADPHRAEAAIGRSGAEARPRRIQTGLRILANHGRVTQFPKHCCIAAFVARSYPEYFK